MVKKKTEDTGWKELCSWVEKELMGYDENQKLQKKACLRLRGLAKGQNVANNNCEQFGSYSYDVILLTFKANKISILNGFKGKNFSSEENQISYACAVVRDKINDMYTRVQNAKKSEEKIDKVDTQVITNKTAEYKKTEKKINKKLEDLW